MDKLALWRHNMLAFFTDVLTHPDGRSYGANLNAWQREDFEAVSRGAQCTSCNVWWERPRGHSKTMDSAALALHHLLTTPGARAYFCASDRDQAALAYDSLRGFVQRSRLLAGAFKLGRWEVVAPSTDAKLEVLSSDAPSSWGLRPSLVVADELQAWRGDAGDEFFYSLYSALGKVPDARMLVGTTAGWDRESLCWKLRELAKDDEAWVFSRRGQCASWITAEFLDEQKRLLPDTVYRQLHLNEWSEGEGSLLPIEVWDRCFDAELRPLQPDLMLGDEKVPLVVGLDAGVKHDCFAAVAVSRHPRMPDVGVAIRATRLWEPPKGGEIAFTGEGSPDAWLRDFCGRHNVVQVTYDPYQLMGLAQEWRRDGVAWCEEFPQGPDRLRADGQLLSLIHEGRLAHSGEPELRRHVLGAGFRLAPLEDTKLRIVKLHPRRRIDLVVALSMASARCLYLNL